MAAPTLAQKKVSTATSATTSGSVTFDTTPASNAYIVVFVFSSVNYSGMSISDAGGNTYTLRQNDGYGTMWGRLYTAQAANNPGAITVTQSSGLLTIVACEVNSYSNASSPEKQGRLWQATNASGSPYSPLNFTATSAAEQLFLGCMGFNAVAGSVDWDAGTGWTSENRNGTTTGQIGHCLISKAVTSTGTYDPEWVATTAGSRDCFTAALSIVSGSDGAGSTDVTVAASGSAMTGGSGTKVPLFQIPL